MHRHQLLLSISNTVVQRQNYIVKGFPDSTVISLVVIVMFCTIRVFIPYAYGTYHTRIPIPYDHTRMVRLIVPYKYGVYS